jgi:hypothetical protein
VVAALLFVGFGLAAPTTSGWGWVGPVCFAIAALFLWWARKPMRLRQSASARFAALGRPDAVSKLMVGSSVTSGALAGWKIAVAHVVDNTFRAADGQVYADVDVILTNGTALATSFHADTSMPSNSIWWTWTATARSVSYSPPDNKPVGERNSRSIPQDVKVAVSARDGGKCKLCGSTKDIQFDHVIPWSRGGASTVKNIQLLCGPCNRRKSDAVRDGRQRT